MIAGLSACACVMAMLGSLLVSRGALRPAYYVGAATGCVYLALNLLLAAGGQPSVLPLVIPSAWGVAMALLGLRRLRAERQEHLQRRPLVYKTLNLRRDNCDGNEKHLDVDVLVVEDLITGQTLLLCQKCFFAQLKLRAKGRRPEEQQPLRATELRPTDPKPTQAVPAAVAMGNGPGK